MYSSLKPHEHALTMEIKKMGQTAFLELETICNLRIKNGHIFRNLELLLRPSICPRRLPRARRKPEPPLTPGGWSRGTGWLRCQLRPSPNHPPHSSGPSFLLGMRGCNLVTLRAQIMSTSPQHSQRRGRAEAPRDATAVSSPGPGAWRGERPGALETS